MFIKLRENKAFTLVEIMIVVAIIGLLVAIAVPNFVKARATTRKNTCWNNLRVITHAVEEWAMDENAAPTAAADSDIFGADLYIKVKPTCPNGGTYTLYDATALKAKCDLDDTYPD